MKTSIIAIAVAGISLSGAVPLALTPRQAPLSDADILNYALTLEHLEDTFYRTGISNFTQAQFAAAGFDADFYSHLLTVANDEKTHVAFLTAGLNAAGATPVQECTYSFPVTDPASFVMVSSILEGVGVSAYLGAAASIMSAEYLTDAGSILTIEARHSAYIRTQLAETPFPQPFDNPLDFNEVYTLAAPFIVSCPAGNPVLPLSAFPTLALDPASPAVITSGTTINLLTPDITLTGTVFGAFITVTGPIFVPTVATATGFSVVVPSGINGQSYVVLTDCQDSVTDDTVVAGPAIVEVTNY